MEHNFYEKIKKFNEIYNLPINKTPTLPSVKRLENFKSILLEEISEIDQIIAEYKRIQEPKKEEEIELLTKISDLFGDIIVYISSEAAKYGLNLEETLKIIMESNMSKLGENGKPIYDERGKIMKGPNYFPPEKKIKKFIEKQIENTNC